MARRVEARLLRSQRTPRRPRAPRGERQGQPVPARPDRPHQRAAVAGRAAHRDRRGLARRRGRRRGRPAAEHRLRRRRRPRRRSRPSCRCSSRSAWGWSRARRTPSSGSGASSIAASTGARWSTGSRPPTACSRADAKLGLAARAPSARAARWPRTSTGWWTPRARACARRAGRIPSRATRAASGAGCAGACRGPAWSRTAGRVVFAGYADVQRPEGWLLQGVYTWPESRRRGYGSLGVSDLCREAFASGADHVQLSVVDGNEPRPLALREPRLPALRQAAHDPLLLAAVGAA